MCAKQRAPQMHEVLERPGLHARADRACPAASSPSRRTTQQSFHALTAGHRELDRSFRRSHRSRRGAVK
jgi:hypothetical protein